MTFKRVNKRILVIGIILIPIILLFAVADRYTIVASSMEPTLLRGDVITANSIYYNVRLPFSEKILFSRKEPMIGDIAIFKDPQSRKKFIKRIVAMEGDELKLTMNRLFVNGTAIEQEQLTKNQIKQLGKLSQPKSAQFEMFDRNIVVETNQDKKYLVQYYIPSASWGAAVVPEGHVFMMGDNRDMSKDSRYIGFIKKTDLLGKLIGISYSIDKKNSSIRTERSFIPVDRIPVSEK